MPLSVFVIKNPAITGERKAPHWPMKLLIPAAVPTISLGYLRCMNAIKGPQLRFAKKPRRTKSKISIDIFPV